MNKEESIVFVDIDGVLADFMKGWSSISNGVKPEDITTKAFWKIINSVGKDKFFYFLPWMPDGKELWSFISNNFINVKILSSLGVPDKLTIKGKFLWLNKNIPELTEEDIILVPDKHKKQQYSGPGRIIIDDTESNIVEWNSKGGIGIWHKNARDTIKRLQKFI